MSYFKSILNYDELCKVVDTELPFRGRKRKEYPLQHRKDGRRYFTVEGEGKDRSFRIYNGLDWARVILTKEEYDAKVAANESRVYSNGNTDYFQWVDSPSELCVVSGDGFATITAKHMGQGNRRLLDYCHDYRYYGSRYYGSRYYGYFLSSVGHGGVIYKNSKETKMFPICAGMRINFNDMTLDPSSEYELIGRRVNRKKSKELHQQREEFFKVTKAMMSSIPKRVFADMSHELLIDHEIIEPDVTGSSRFWRMKDLKVAEKTKAIAFELMDSSPLDAAALFCCLYDTKGFWREAQHTTLIKDTPVDYLYESMCRKIWEDTYRRNQLSVMESKSFEVGKPFPWSLGKYEFYQNGELLPQY